MLIGSLITASTHIFQKQFALQEKNHAVAHTHAVVDLLVRDMQHAPQQYHLWKKIRYSSVIWHTSSSDQGWIFKKGKLYAEHGTYDAYAGRWRKRAVGITLNNVTSVLFSPIIHVQNKTKLLAALLIEIRLKNGDIIRRMVALRNSS